MALDEGCQISCIMTAWSKALPPASLSIPSIPGNDMQWIISIAIILLLNPRREWFFTFSSSFSNSYLCVCQLSHVSSLSLIFNHDMLTHLTYTTGSLTGSPCGCPASEPLVSALVCHLYIDSMHWRWVLMETEHYWVFGWLEYMCTNSSQVLNQRSWLEILWLLMVDDSSEWLLILILNFRPCYPIDLSIKDCTVLV